MIALILFFATTVSAAPTKDIFLALASEDIPKITGLYETPIETIPVPQITGLYETPREVIPETSEKVSVIPPFISQNEVPDEPVAVEEDPNFDLPGLVKIDLRNSPSEESSIISGADIPSPLPLETEDLPAKPLPVDLDAQVNLLIPSEPARNDPFNLDQNLQQLTDIFEAPKEPEIPSGLYETPLASLAIPIFEPKDNIPQPQQISINILPTTPSPSTTTMMMGMPYDFQYGVEDDASGNLYRRAEKSDGKTVSGRYEVQLPDGRTQVVEYFDKGEGFNVVVTYKETIN